MGKGAKLDYRPTRVKEPGVLSSPPSEVSNPKLEKSRYLPMETEMDMLVRHYQDRLAELVNEDHLHPGRPFCLLPRPTRQFHSNRLCDSATDLCKVRNRMLRLLYYNNHSYLLPLLVYLVPLEVVEHHSLAEEVEVDIEIEMDSTRMLLDNISMHKDRDSFGVNKRCLILCRLNRTICKCTEGDLCPLLLNPKLLFRD